MASTKNVQVVEKNTGTKIEWRQSNLKLIFGDDDLAIRCDTRQRDWPVHVDVCADDDGNLVIGVGTGRYYVAQIDIPAIEYSDTETDNGETERTALPLDMSKVVLTLWSIDDLKNNTKEDIFNG